LISGTSINAWLSGLALRWSAIALQVHLGLAASGHAEQQERSEALRAGQRRDCVRLLCRQLARRRVLVRSGGKRPCTQPAQRLGKAGPGASSQRRRQGRQGNLAPRMLVIVSREPGELEPMRPERSDVLGDGRNGLQPAGVDGRAVGHIDDQSDLGTPADGNDAGQAWDCTEFSEPIIERLR
jgi:hypothetical protein